MKRSLIPVHQATTIGDNASPSGDVHIDSNLTGYFQPGSSNFEHDDTGNQMNLSGVYDEIVSAQAEHEDWQPGYDY